MRRSERTAARRSAGQTKCQAHVRGAELSVRRGYSTARLSARRRATTTSRIAVMPVAAAEARFDRATPRAAKGAAHGTPCAVETVSPQRFASESTTTKVISFCTAYRTELKRISFDSTNNIIGRRPIRLSRVCGLARYAKLLRNAARNCVACDHCFSRMSEEERRP